jgi:Ca-activated chloride channel family protein
MKSKLLLVMLVCSCMSIAVKAQSLKEEIRGKITDYDDKTSLAYTSVSAFSSINHQVKAQVLSNEDGTYKIANLDTGLYDIQFHFLGYKKIILQGRVRKDTILFANVRLHKEDSKMLETVVVKAKVPLIRPDGANVKTIGDPIKLSTRNINSIANVAAGVDSRAGQTPTFRGSRTDGTAYYADGVRVQGSATPAQTNGTQVQTGGLPHQMAAAPMLVQNDETYTRIEENKFKTTKDEPLSTFSNDVDKASYAVVRRYLNDHMIPPADAVRIEEMINYFPYDVKAENQLHPFSIKTEVSQSPWNKDHKLVHITLKAPEIDTKEAPPSNLVFLVDVSGSMQSYDKLYLLKDCLKLLIERLKPSDHISMVVYAGNEGLVLDGVRGSEKTTILNALDQLSAGGSTAGGAGINLAYKIAEKHFIKDGNNRIILATDGDFNVGVSSPEELTKLIEQKRETGVFLSVLGFGTGNLKDANMETLADKGNGNYSYIDNILEGKKVLVSEAGSTLFTVAKDVKIQIEFNPKYVRSYRLIGYENRLLNNEDFNDDKKDAGEIGAGHCVTAIYEIITKEEGKTEVSAVDDLKYQQQTLTAAAITTELMNVKVRYKKPDGKTSIKFEIPVYDTEKPFEQVSEDMRFAVAVAVFGMKLRNSSFVKEIQYDQIIQMCKAAKGTDEGGYRAELIKMVETAQLLASK